ncbi:MAG: hypothetical protein A2X28_11465 [Elusimicrobia bacterium GWA2_56_46]|nr:MAG: hypothetical protein A2X28_11465 [Elusimicrobia bacterium GWA2_56_46]OGR54553.1 MAG: hypothetical protein A2X39_10250 [Elusimicrobia bacterium GWC2_56_31]HBB67239.1 hypothetical protein [Elusimicrobiota bacterium]HBW22359.1 hypothetical protein [Elusimicrobiota bacterium]
MELNKLLEGLINEEFLDVSIYNAEAGLFAEKLIGGARIAEIFSVFAREEAEHALALMKITGKKGGVKTEKISVGSSLRQCLEMHVKRESLSVDTYNELLERLAAPEHKMIIKGIIAQETEHLRAAKEYLAKIRAANEK